ncbi:MAG TPA: hypothetical protein VG013_09950 [Gemmataceae bacterium]|jgi:hypothetical protein|nr:hypothetical protein [Gemmataceae bacterium]
MNEFPRGEGHGDPPTLPEALPLADKSDVRSSARIGGDSLPAARALVACWRCGKEVTPADGLCVHCHARLVTDSGTTVRPVRRRAGGKTLPLLMVMWVFAALLCTSLVHGWFHRFGLSDEHQPGQQGVERVRNDVLLAELVDTVLVVAALWCIPRPLAPDRAPRPRRLLVWAAAGPLLAVMLGLNLGYHWLLRQFFLAPVLPEEQLFRWRMSWWTVLAVCVQPAIVEELYFRYLAWAPCGR